MLDKFRIRSTFFIPAWTAQEYAQHTREIVRRGHEVAAHGYLHENLSELSEQQEWSIHDRSTRILEELTGKRPVGFRAPYWEWSTRTLAQIRKCGYKYDSSLMNDDKPYTINSCGTKFHELPVEWFLDDWTLFEELRQPPSTVLDAWKSEFDSVYALEVGYFMLTMHPECIGRASRMTMLEQLLRHISRKRDIVFARCAELVQYLGDAHRKTVESRRPSSRV
jgi:peptidoglycan/xylan/chitin deacetylase (PgdA/CDA1 family)